MSLFEPLIRRHELDDKSLGIVYAQLDEIAAAITDFRAEALRRAKLGIVVDGQKLVYGNRGPRKWTDKQAAETALSMLMEPEKIYEPREIVSPTQAERLLKKDYASIEGLVT